MTEGVMTSLACGFQNEHGLGGVVDDLLGKEPRELFTLGPSLGLVNIISVIRMTAGAGQALSHGCVPVAKVRHHTH